MEKIDKGIGWLQKMLNLEKRYGFFSIVKGLLLILLSGLVVFFTLNPQYLLERVADLQTKQHDRLVESRLSADSGIRQILTRTIYNANADRAWLIEFHNGSKNIATGLPFLFGSMRIEEVRDGILNVDEDYSDFSLSKYKLISKVIDDGYFYGSIEQVRQIDERLFYKFKSNNINEIALLTLYDGEKPIGFIGLSFCNDKRMNKQMVGRLIRCSGIQIATLLSKVDGRY